MYQCAKTVEQIFEIFGEFLKFYILLSLSAAAAAAAAELSRPTSLSS